MIKSLATVVALGLMLGCDDPDVRNKIDAILDYGAVEARVECAGSFSTPITGGDFWYSGSRLLDGSAIVSLNMGGGTYQNFWSRDQPEAADMYAINGLGTSRMVWEAHDGDLTITCTGCNGPPDTSPDVFDIETQCTGFNLEAFE